MSGKGGGRISFELTERDARTVVRALDHLIFGCTNTGLSSYGIDVFCRSDCASHLQAIKNDILANLPSIQPRS